MALPFYKNGFLRHFPCSDFKTDNGFGIGVENTSGTT